MFITSSHREYWNNLIVQNPEERNESGVDVCTLGANLARSPEERLNRIHRYTQILTQLFPPARVFDGRCIITNRLAAALEDYLAAKQSENLDQLELAQWAIDMMVPEPFIPPRPFPRRWREPR